MAPLMMTSHFANFGSMTGGAFGAALALAVALEEDIEIHSRVQARHLLAVAVERQRLAPPGLADPLLGRLAPPRVRVLRVDVREEAVLARRAFAPGRRRLRRD